ncbi:MAG: hypothetical protein JMDDDDMK_00482 [Acidobacteria bacterium]|nr:hypothetical protein [Acidobacteriota bacterium]
MGLIDELLATYDDLLQRAQKDTPNLIETAALASILHSFYNGLENIFMRVAKKIDQHVPTGEQWHRDLLQQMACSSERRSQVVSAEAAEALREYLSFRHFFRHGYSSRFDWSRMAIIAQAVREVWALTRKEIEEFLRVSESAED